MIKNILVALLFVFCVKVGSAQFYDGADDIYFYVNVKEPVWCIVLNFDGDKATCFSSGMEGYQFSRNKVSEILNSNQRYYEDRTQDALYKMNYTNLFDGVAYMWSVRRDGLYGSWYDSYVMEFSDDRGTLFYKCYPQNTSPTRNTKPSKTETYKKVSKSEFLTRGRRR